MEIELNQAYRINQLSGTSLPMSGRISAVKQCIRWASEKFDIFPSHFEVDLRPCGEEFGIWAAVNCTDHDQQEFYIMIDPNVDINDFFLALCHEMIHVWQTCRGDLLSEEFEDAIYWMNRKIDTNEVPYLLLPWEEEAHRLEEEIFNEWVKYWNDQRA